MDKIAHFISQPTFLMHYSLMNTDCFCILAGVNNVAVEMGCGVSLRHWSLLSESHQEVGILGSGGSINKGMKKRDLHEQ